MDVTLSELRHAIPQRGTGAPHRTEAHFDNILNLFIERNASGEKYVYASELYSHPELYGRSPRNRISEARTKAGHEIGGESHGTSDWRYWLIRLNPGAPPRRQWAKIKKKAVQQPLDSSQDWFTRSTGQPRPARPQPDLGPLFDAAVRS